LGAVGWWVGVCLLREGRSADDAARMDVRLRKKGEGRDGIGWVVMWIGSWGSGCWVGFLGMWRIGEGEGEGGGEV